MSGIGWQCAGCGFEVPGELKPAPSSADAAGRGAPVLFCPRREAGDGVDHVLRRRVDPSIVAWPAPGGAANPFVRFRTLLSSHQSALASGMDDERFVAIAGRLDDAIARIDGHGFRATPFAPQAALASAIGLLPATEIWIKDETGNVSGSHKARHLAGVMLHLLVAEERSGSAGGRPPLGIASCGNAALAAAVVAGAVGWPLSVFVPPDAERVVLARLAELGAAVTTCPRRPGERGDPCYLRFREAIAGGALPFCCQGPDNGLTIEGGETLAWEMIDAPGAPVPDRLFVQVGGGALASSLVQGLEEARALGRIDRVPRLHAVQTRGAFPLERGYRRLLARIESALGLGASGDAPLSTRALAVHRVASAGALGEAVAFARAHRAEFMWPWESEPHSVAHGILDDETYDFAAVVEGMLVSGGWPIVVDEETLVEANEVGRRATGIDVDHTGSAGLAGLIALAREGRIGAGERAAVVFSGRRRAR